MLTFTLEHTIPAAYALLPPRMASREASAFILAIGLQESKFNDRRQMGAPAFGHGFWQFERAGILGVLDHPASRPHIQAATAALRYTPTVSVCHAAIVDNDVLACIFARLLLWTIPAPLPTFGGELLAWGQYLATWRPGKPRPLDWPGNYAQAWEAVA
jgi:hypothetical protein